MSETTLRATLKTIVESLTNEGTVHDYERWSADTSDYLTLFKTTISGVNYIRGWTITLESMPQTLHQTDGTMIRQYNHRIRMYWGLNDSDASEKSAVAMAIGAVEALDASTTLHDGDTYYNADPASLEVFEARVFGGVLCHYTEILQTTYEVQS